jgi:hypothetical protein
MKNHFIFILILILFYSNIFSQDFEVAPVKIIFSVDPGSKQEKTLSIKNHSNIKQDFLITVEDYIVDKYGNKQSLPKNSTKNSAADWLSLSSSFFSINPNESVEVNVTMTPPGDNWATRWAYIYVQTTKERTAFNSDKKSTQTGVVLNGRIGIQVIRSAQVKFDPVGKISELKEIEENNIGNRVFTALVNNNGPTIFDAKITFLAADLNTAKEIEFTPIFVEVYPGFVREITFTLPDNLPAGEYSLAAILDYGSKLSLEGTRLQKKLIIIR